MSGGFHLDLTSGWAALLGIAALIVVLVALNCVLFHKPRGKQ